MPARLTKIQVLDLLRKKYHCDIESPYGLFYGKKITRCSYDYGRFSITHLNNRGIIYSDINDLVDITRYKQKHIINNEPFCARVQDKVVYFYPKRSE